MLGTNNREEPSNSQEVIAPLFFCTSPNLCGVLCPVLGGTFKKDFPEGNEIRFRGVAARMFEGILRRKAEEIMFNEETERGRNMTEVFECLKCSR